MGQPIKVELEEGARVVLIGLPAVLGDEEIVRHLTSGLTTTLAFRAELRGHESIGGARVEVRYELWEEVFQVVAVGIDGRGERQELADLEALASWWSTLRLTVLELAGDQPAAGQNLELTLEVVPFSASEQDDTQRWFSRSFGASKSGDSERVTDAAERRGDSLENVLGVLMATSIQRHPVLTRSWKVSIPGGG
jgi:hypothetical protein